MHSQSQPGELGEDSLPDSYKNMRMLLLNGLECLVFARKITPAELFDKADVRIFSLIYEDKHLFVLDTINSCSMEVMVFHFLSANITGIKTHLFHVVCSNV